MTRKCAKRFNQQPAAFDRDMFNVRDFSRRDSVAAIFAALRRNGFNADQSHAIAKGIRAAFALESSFDFAPPIDFEPMPTRAAFDTWWRKESDGLIVRVEFCADDEYRDDSDCWGEMVRRSESAGWQHETTPGDAGEEVYSWHWNYREAFAYHRRTMARNESHLRVLGDMRREYDQFQRRNDSSTFGIVVTVFDADANELGDSSCWGFDYENGRDALADSDLLDEALDGARQVYAAPDVAAALVDMRGV